MEDNSLVAARGQMMQYAFGSMITLALAAAARLEIVDQIGDGEATVAEIARACGTDERSTLRLLRCLAALEVTRETEPGVFALNPAGQLLRRDHPESVRDVMLLWGDAALTDAWRELDKAIISGQKVFDEMFGVDFFGYLGQRPQLSARFNAAMSQASALTARELPECFDFAPYATIVDVGGGDGTLLSAILRRHPQPRGVVFDTAEGLENAGTVLQRAGVAERCRTESGDFFAGVPAGGDLYVLKSVIHDWDDERAAVILRHCAAGVTAGGRILVIEPELPEVVPSPSHPLGAIQYASDLNMLVNLGGMERTRADFVALLESAGLNLVEVHAPRRMRSFRLIEARVAE